MLRGKLLIISVVLILLLVVSHEAQAMQYEALTQTTVDLDPSDVDAINRVAHALRLTWESDESEFSSKGCNSSSKVLCDCSFNDHTLCRVTRIDLSDMHLRGEIPPAIGNLTCLISLDLGSNRIHGNIPDSLRNLNQLQYLDLSSNDLEGPIPDFFGEMNSLNVLILAENWLKGSIPQNLGNSSSIKTLDLAENLLSERIPESLGNISNLEFLRLSDNQLTGLLPKSLGNLQNVYRMVLANNKFQGQLPPCLANLTNLRHFNVRGNEFIGPIPRYIGNWNQLEILILQGNHFEGPLPDTISSLKNVTEMRIADLYGRNGEVFPFPDISRMIHLETLVLRNCSINDSIPRYIGGFQALSHLDLSYNKLTGEVPDFPEYGNLTNIFLRANKLTGPIPTWFSNKTEANLDFSENNFTYSSIVNYRSNRNMNSFACCSPSVELDNAWQRNNFSCDEDKLENDRLYINCGGEKVTAGRGTFERDTQPEGASTFYISDDRKWGYSSMGIYDPTQSKSMSYTHSIESHDECGFENKDASLYKTARVAPVSLKYFGFCMKNGLYIVKLDFAEITFKEEAEHKSRGNRLFDVFIQGRKVLADFNIKDIAGGLNKNASQAFQAEVRENSLEIHLYWAGKGSKRGPFELYGPLVSAISVEPVVKPVKPPKKLSPLSIAGISGSIVLFLVLIFVCLWKMGYLRGKESKIEAQKELISLPGGGLFTYRQLKVATQNFNKENKIGEGGFGAVFKGVLPNGTVIAVKQLSAKSKQGSREFVNEVGVISALQHLNLVKLLGCCIDENQLLLVYEYMENNSLAHALFGPEELRVQLNWAIRSKICRGIAKGLAFLHEESKLKIIHRDIKTTNILLDKDFTAKISDFGFAKLHEGEKTHVITKIAGTTGYMAPEYAMRGHLTSKADVYSFGVVLLEIVSGQNSASYRPNDESVYLLDLAYVLQEKGDLLALVDPILGSEYSAKEAKTILELAMLCTNPSPTLRPSMSEVVKILKGKSRLNYTPSLAPYSADGFARAKAMASRSFSNYSRSMSREEPSNPASCEFSIKEEEVHISADYTPEITDETGRSPLNNV
ncbi:probable LRR receptor-like serine/threonine-protein kinase At1g53430 [Durio zibethinus]|uniref:non-specific serine/threonine protein kinase n=1 Tax=Durio zibethinus TaxID=66656 RepID=A0A6P5WIC0_DURZI|nr:probable LRR receptor-like serine/threonine-protein kinase At1g53430 [Durio zibethinus]XP_022715699.1 probable LRR receptor-like serine/threonine-protein kinase At1g53430 [Durio zibethinus]